MIFTNKTGDISKKLEIYTDLMEEIRDLKKYVDKDLTEDYIEGMDYRDEDEETLSIELVLCYNKIGQYLSIEYFSGMINNHAYNTILEKGLFYYDSMEDDEQIKIISDAIIYALEDMTITDSLI